MPTAVPDYLAGLNGDIAGLKIGLPREYFTEGLQPEVAAAAHAAAAQLEKMGAQIQEVSLEHADYCLPA